MLSLVACSTCRDAASDPAPPIPASILVIASPAPVATVGAVAGTASVKVLDAHGDPLSGVVVTFAITRGAGQLSVVSARTDFAGVASSVYRAGTQVTNNEVSVFVTGLPATKFTVLSAAGGPKSIVFGQRSLKYAPAVDSLFATAVVRDTFLNTTGLGIIWTTRNPALIGVTPSGGGAAVRALSRPGSTWLIATSAAATDSLLVIVQDSTSTPCTFVATPSAAPVSIGATLAFDGGTVCVKPTVAGAEYVVVAHYNTGAYPVSQSIEVTGDGITTAVSSFPVAPPPMNAPSSELRSDLRFEQRMREQEAREITPRVPSARAAMAASRQTPWQSNLVAPPRIGDVVSLNVNAEDFCAAPDLREGQVVAVNKTAIVVTDISNPPGGFTANEYLAFAADMDTLVLPVDTAAFGSPSDVDGNGRVMIFFTRAVNELTPPGSPAGVVLGFYYRRDLLPRRSEFGDCPGSNVSELLYLLVPDTSGVINGNVRSKNEVATSIVGTIAHEFQHLINASRRLYETNALRAEEDTWLSEGLSHIAEELVFYRASGLSPRGNIGAAQLPAGSFARTAFDKFGAVNFGRYRQFLLATESNSPLANDGFLSTRGATWAFLRYLADRVRSNDGDFWRNLVNSRWTGVTNADSVLAGTGVTVFGALRDWSMAVLVDDIAPVASTALQQPSWNFLSAFQGAYGQPFALNARILLNGITSGLAVFGGGTSFLRFGVAQNREALIRVTAFGGGPLPAGMRLTLVRIK